MRDDGYIAPPAIKTVKKLPPSFVEKFNSKGDAYLFHRNDENGKPGINAVIQNIHHLKRIGAFEHDGTKLRVCSFFFFGPFVL